jgi:hypothetical protein
MLSLHVRCIEGTGIASPLQDAFWELRFTSSTGRHSVAKTRAIHNSVSPKWREDFTFKVTDFLSDWVLGTVFDLVPLFPDDPYCDFQIIVRKLPIGVTVDKWFETRAIQPTEQPRLVHVLMHLGLPEDVPFVNRPFPLLLAHFRVISLVGACGTDPTGYYVVLSWMPEMSNGKRMVWRKGRWIGKKSFTLL